MRLITSAAVLIAFFCYQGLGQAQRFQSRNANAVPEHSRSKECHEANARYAVSDQCDKYIQCTDGIAEEKLCPDGLLFNDKLSVYKYPCQYPIDVNCTTRSRTQKAEQATECPHLFGYFGYIKGAADCGDFLNCADGRPYNLTCPLGLAFNPKTYQCDYPDLVEDCDAEGYLNFRCPQEQRLEGFGVAASENKFHKSDDCQKYFLCVNGRPRLYVCGVGTAFAHELNRCEKAENVTGCQHLKYVEEELPSEKQPIYLKTLKIKS